MVRPGTPEAIKPVFDAAREVQDFLRRSGRGQDWVDLEYVITGIETLDLTGSGNNTLNLALADLLDMSNSTNQLFVNGNAGDKVNVVGAGWSNAGTSTVNGILYTHYVNGAG